MKVGLYCCRRYLRRFRINKKIRPPTMKATRQIAIIVFGSIKISFPIIENTGYVTRSEAVGVCKRYSIIRPSAWSGVHRWGRYVCLQKSVCFLSLLGCFWAYAVRHLKALHRLSFLVWTSAIPPYRSIIKLQGKIANVQITMYVIRPKADHLGLLIRHPR